MAEWDINLTGAGRKKSWLNHQWRKQKAAGLSLVERRLFQFGADTTWIKGIRLKYGDEAIIFWLVCCCRPERPPKALCRAWAKFKPDDKHPLRGMHKYLYQYTPEKQIEYLWYGYIMGGTKKYTFGPIHWMKHIQGIATVNTQLRDNVILPAYRDILGKHFENQRLRVDSCDEEIREQVQGYKQKKADERFAKRQKKIATQEKEAQRERDSRWNWIRLGRRKARVVSR